MTQIRVFPRHFELFLHSEKVHTAGRKSTKTSDTDSILFYLGAVSIDHYGNPLPIT